MDAAVLFSGGKDSTFALYKINKKYNLKCLISIKPKSDSSYMFHYPNIDLVKTQAKLLNLPLIFVKTKGEKEEELKDLEKAIKLAIRKYKIKAIISGALASNYQKSRIEELCKKYNLKSVAPLWHINSEKYLKELIKNKFEVIITGIAADGLNESFLGRKIDNSLIQDFKKLNIPLTGEGGCFETFVTWMPIFKKRIIIKEAYIKMESKYCGEYKIKKIILI